MDTTKFDAVARLFGSGMTRREALRGLVAGAAAVTVGGAILSVEDASAKRRRRRKNKRNKKNTQQDQGREPGSPCTNDQQCTSDYICEVPVNGSNSDTYCCGAQGAGCGAEDENEDDTAPYCCVGHECVYNPGNGSWTCQYLPDEL